MIVLRLVDSSREALLAYVSQQGNNFFPDGRSEFVPVIERHIDEALGRLDHCIAGVRMWRAGEFNYLHSSQYAIFLYYLSNTIWRQERDARTCTKLFLLNKTLNGIDCFYEIEMPRVFFIGHSVGIVLAKAEYGEYLVLYQNSTVGKNHGQAPRLGAGAILYPNSAVIGDCKLGDNTTLAQGACLIDQSTPGDCLVFRAAAESKLVPARRRYVEDYFRF